MGLSRIKKPSMMDSVTARSTAPAARSFILPIGSFNSGMQSYCGPVQNRPDVFLIQFCLLSRSNGDMWSPYLRAASVSL